MKTLLIFLTALFLFGCNEPPVPELPKFTTVSGVFDEATVFAITEGVGSETGKTLYEYHIGDNLRYPFDIHSFRFKCQDADWKTITPGVSLEVDPQGFVRVYGDNQCLHDMDYELVVNHDG